jgi:hypothetical protein
VFCDTVGRVHTLGSVMVCRSERFRLAIEAKNEEGEENRECGNVELMDRIGDGGGTNGESEWSEISKFRDCEPMRIARIAKGSEANPSRRATKGDWSTYECCVNKKFSGWYDFYREDGHLACTPAANCTSTSEVTT